MKKIVINSCYGGFSLSNAALARYAELKGKKAYFFKTDLGNSPRYIPIDETNNNLLTVAFTVPNPNELFKTNKTWGEMTLEERRAENERYTKCLLSKRDIPRDDGTLVQVVEELKDKADGQCAKLKIVSIPDDVEWEIEEYDGMEHVAEKHRIWS